MTQNAKKPSSERSTQRKIAGMSALNKAVIPAIWYSFASASVARRGCRGFVFSRRSGFTGSATRKPTSGCNGLLNRHGKRIAPLARIQSFLHATILSFPERVIRSFTGFLQTSQYAIKWVRCPQCEDKTAFLRIEGRIYTLASGLLSGSASGDYSTSCVSHPALGRASSRAF